MQPYFWPLSFSSWGSFWRKKCSSLRSCPCALWSSNNKSLFSLVKYRFAKSRSLLCTFFPPSFILSLYLLRKEGYGRVGVVGCSAQSSSFMTRPKEWRPICSLPIPLIETCLSYLSVLKLETWVGEGNSISERWSCGSKISLKLEKVWDSSVTSSSIRSSILVFTCGC